MDAPSEASLPRTAALLAGAGAGTRLGLGPKAFLRLGELTLLEHLHRTFDRQVDEVVVAVPADLVQEAQRLLPEAVVTAGGSSRQETVSRLLAHTSAPLVAIHDVARPFLERSVLKRILLAANRVGAASAALPVADTLVRTDGSGVDRSGLWAIQTPQAFRRELLGRAHENARRSRLEATDDAGLVRALGEPVELVEGSPWLFKITGEADHAFASELLPAWELGRG